MFRLIKRDRCRLGDLGRDLSTLADCVGRYVGEGVNGTAAFIEVVSERLAPKNREAAFTALGMAAATAGKELFTQAAALALPIIESREGRIFVLKTLSILYSGLEAARVAASAKPPLTEDEYASLLSTLACDELERIPSIPNPPPQLVRAYAKTALRSLCGVRVKAEGVKALFTLASQGLMTKEEVAAMAKELGMRVALVRGRGGVAGVTVSVSGLSIRGDVSLTLSVVKGLKAIGAL